ncbi:Omp28-related outer membrane protein [Sinomicrobium pectinilyticum]|uniref:Thioredoxin domain-containing protein n=1 Tax=Sinomicrobium pectinilyticum TaxID=1084421 RepID=A0A3N0DR18_SINP1|nr:Omp28-related outer membrane protein [Sinomicrobium pectinilyticum]RNL77951.1 hypothetical protein ED312_20240 [Sinomicrobium pectinilyticum]
MKNKYVLLMLLLVSAFSLTCLNSCSKGDDDAPDNNEKTPDVADEELKYEYKMLVDQFTADWCQYCPLAHYYMDVAKEEIGDKIVMLTWHADPLAEAAKEKMEELASNLGVGGYPTLFQGRYREFSYPTVLSDKNFDPKSDNDKLSKNIEKDFLDIIEESSPVGIAISSSLEKTKGRIEIEFAFPKDMSGLSYAAYVVEDKIIRPQVDATEGRLFPNLKFGDIEIMADGKKYDMEGLADFEHNDVVRGATGTVSVPKENMKEGSYKTTLDINYISENIENLKVVIVATDKRGISVNTQIAPGNTKVDFQIIK